MTFLAAVELTGVAVSTLVAIGSAPIFSGILSRLVHRRWVISTGLAVLGVAMLLTGAGAQVSWYGIVAALAAGFSYALYTVASGSLARAQYAAAPVTAAGFVVAAVLLAPALLLTDNRWLVTPAGAGMVLYLAAVATTAAYLLFVRGLRHVPPPTAQVVGLVEPVVATALGVLVLGERIRPVAALGCVLVVAALVVVARGPSPGVDRIPA